MRKDLSPEKDEKMAQNVRQIFTQIVQAEESGEMEMSEVKNILAYKQDQHLLILNQLFYSSYQMNSSDLFATTDPRLQNLMRQYSDYFRQNNLNLENFNLTQSTHPQMYNLSPKNDVLLNGENRRGSDVRSLIEQLMTKKQIKTTSNINVNAPRPVLVNTEQRIFQQVVNLLLQINQIKTSIQKERDLTAQMEVERDSLLNKGSNKNKQKKTNDFEMQSIINKLKSKDGEELKISVAQLEKITAQNEHLERNINRLKLKSKGNLKQVLQQEKQKYRTLKKKLEEKNYEQAPPSKENLNFKNSQVLEEITKLEADIARLQSALEDGSNISLQIRNLSEENEKLKLQTIDLINQERLGSVETPEEAQERKRLQQHIREEEQNKILFFEDLKKFKEEYNALKSENEQLKAKLKGSHSGSRVESLLNHGRQEDMKFGKYEDLMAEMNTVMK